MTDMLQNSLNRPSRPLTPRKRGRSCDPEFQAAHASNADLLDSRVVAKRLKASEWAAFPTTGVDAPKEASSKAAPLSPSRRTELEGLGRAIKDVHIVGSERFPDLVILVPEYGGDHSRWCAFHVGRDCVAQASQFMRRALTRPFLESSAREIVMSDCQVDARFVEQALRGLYGERCVPTIEDAVELISLLDYWMPKGAPNSYWSDLQKASSKVLTDGTNAENVVGLWRRAVHVAHPATIKCLLSHLISAPDEELLKLSLDEIEHFANHPANTTNEAEILSLVTRWSEKNESSASETPKAKVDGRLVRSIRWLFVPEDSIWEALANGTLSRDESVDIAVARSQLRRGGGRRPLLFGEPLRGREKHVAKVTHLEGTNNVVSVSAKFLNIRANAQAELLSSQGFTAFDCHWFLVLAGDHQLLLTLHSGHLLREPLRGEIKFKPLPAEPTPRQTAPTFTDELLLRLLGVNKVRLSSPNVPPESQPVVTDSVRELVEDYTFSFTPETPGRAWPLNGMLRGRDSWNVEFTLGPLFPARNP